MNPIETAWEALSNTMRLFAEASGNFKLLFKVDQEEAIANHDRAFESKLEAFHRLYDVTRTIPGFAYFAHGDTALLVHLRNALHHRDHTLFVSWNAMLFGAGGINQKAGATYLLASYDGLSALAAKYFLPLHDFYARLEHGSVKNPGSTKAKWDQELGFALIAKQGAQGRYPRDQVYVDVMPIFISAISRIMIWLNAAQLAPMGFDGQTYAIHFTELPSLDLTKPRCRMLHIPMSFGGPA